MVKVASCPCILPPSARRCASWFRSTFQQRKGLHLASPLVLGQSLQDQGIAGAATLSSTYVPTDFYAAWCYAQGYPVLEGELALEGLTQMEGTTLGEYVHHLPQSLNHLTFGRRFNESLEGVTLPNNLQSLTFGHDFNQSLKGVPFPSSLQRLILAMVSTRAWQEWSHLANQSSKLDLRM